MKRLALGWALFLAAVSISLIGCGSSNSTPQTRLRFINAAVGSGGNQAVDVQVNGVTVARSVGFGTETGGITVDAGNNVPIRVLAAGTGTTLASGNVSLTANVDQPVLFTGLTGATGTQAPKVVALSPQDLSAPPTSGQVKIYFIHAVPEVGAADFIITPAGGPSISTADMHNVQYIQMTPAEFTTFGSTTFSANVASQPTITSQAIDLTGNKVYLVIFTGRPASSGGNPPLALLVQQLT